VQRGDAIVVDESWGPPRDVASVQKSPVAVLVGIAIARGHLRLDTEWRDGITVEHLLTMTSGLGDALEYVAAPGTRWDYSLIVYPQLKRVLTAAVGRTLEDITAEWLTGPLGMTESSWQPRVWDGTLPPGFKPAFVYPDGEPMEAFVSTARDLVRFGRAAMEGFPGLGVDPDYLARMTRPSQPLNPAYGFLWWVNDCEFSFSPKAAQARPGWFFPSAPADAFAALGAGDQCCVVVPSERLVVARTGEPATTGSLAGSSFVDELVARALTL
jgi:CubicO group peptidase (beta-lactamase class C family)